MRNREILDEALDMDYGLRVFEVAFQELSAKQKKRFLEYDYVENFIKSLNILSIGFGDIVKNVFLTAKIPDNWEKIRQKIIKIGGFIGPILLKDPGSAQFMDLLYRYKNPEGPLDRFLMDCRSGIAVNHRKNSIVRNIAPVIKLLIKGSNINAKLWKRIIVLNLGSGYGYDSIEISKQFREISQYVSFINVDLCPHAINDGRKLLEKPEYKNLAGISFHHRNMIQIKIKNVDMAWVIGVFCGFDYRQCVRYLSIIKNFMAPGGIVYGAYITDKMIKEDLFTSFILEYVLNWRLCYRKADQVRNIFEDAGYVWRSDLAFKEEFTRFYVVGAGEIPNFTKP